MSDPLALIKEFSDTFFHCKVVSILMKVTFVAKGTKISLKISKVLYLLIF